MKFSTTTLALGLARISLARQVHGVYPGAVGKRHYMGDEYNRYDSHDSHYGYNHGGSDNSYDSSNSNSETEIIIVWANPGGGAATTTVNQKVTVTEVVTVAAAGTGMAGAEGVTTTIQGGATATVNAGETSHTVTVGGDAGLVYTPDSLSGIPVGDVVVFEFHSLNHTASQSGFDTPCELLDGGMDSGFMANINETVVPPPQVAMQVMTADPLWFYCRQTGHCGMGMVFSINPSSDKTQAAFKAMAIAQNGTSSDAPPAGNSGWGASSTVSAAAAQTSLAGSSSGASNGSGYASGSGSISSDGSCTCVASCSSGSFPVNAQGIGAFGGVPGSLPLAMV